MLARIHYLFGGFRARLLVLVGGFGILLFCAMQIAYTAAELDKIGKERVNSALDKAAIVARSLEADLVDRDIAEIRKTLASIRAHDDIIDVSVVDRELKLLINAETTSFGLVPVSDASEVQMKSLKSGAVEYSVGGDRIEVGEPMTEGGQVIGALAIAFSNPGGAATAFPLLTTNSLVALPIILAGFGLAVLLGGQIVSQLRRLRDQVRKFADGDLEQQMEFSGFREIGQLGESLSLLTEKLKANIERVYELAYVDRVTQLPNREFFRNEVNRTISRSERNGTAGAVLFVDLDGFKQVNDTLGHAVGDKLLRAFSERISGIIRAGDTISWSGNPVKPVDNEATAEKQVLARLGGDEFTVLLSEIREETDAANVAQRIISATNQIFNIDDVEVKLGASIGIATFPRDGTDYATILRNADLAMYLAKEEGKNTYRFFSEELNNHAARRLEIESDLRRALARNELELYFQPKIECETGRPAGAEALIRWNHPVKGLLDPGEFISVAETTGLVLPLGIWVLEAACDQIRDLQDAGFDGTLSINVSAQQFDQNDFAQRVLGIVETSGIKPQRLELEFTEDMLMTNPRLTLEHFRKLKRAGIRIAIDYFGTGNSNLSLLGRLRFDVAKIDRSFIEILLDETDDLGRRTVSAILAMARSYDCETVAVGVETREQQNYLTEAGCTHLQGYLFGRPMPTADFTRWLSTHPSRNIEALEERSAPAA